MRFTFPARFEYIGETGRAPSSTVLAIRQPPTFCRDFFRNNPKRYHRPLPNAALTHVEGHGRHHFPRRGNIGLNKKKVSIK